jgi:hypothetical protein
MQRIAPREVFGGNGHRRRRPGERRAMIVPASSETPLEDIEFDLDVRLQPVARHVSDDEAAWLPNRAP